MVWVKVFADAAEAKRKILSGKPQLLILHTRRICLVLTGEQFFAVQDACSHQGTSLSGGLVNHLDQIICPLHNYCFDLLTGEEQRKRSADLQTFPIKIDDSGFFVGI
jgi:3-phenylpropionate/trans-cinnamate dioxygenase ferredoxin subunit